MQSAKRIAKQDYRKLSEAQRIDLCSIRQVDRILWLRSGCGELVEYQITQGQTPMKAAIIVAHPDDESIWSGGLILQKPDWEWTVLSLCRADDPDRSRKFESVSGLLGFDAFISDVDDSNPLK